jgi:hypothetical protein
MKDPIDLPKRAGEHVVGEQAVQILKAALPREWVVRDQPVSDYGIDLEIELARSVVSGRIFKGQVKGHSTVEWRTDGTLLQSITQRTLNYWQQFRVPVILFIVDVSKGEVYWAKTQELTTSRGVSGILVRRVDTLPTMINALTWYVVNWIDLQAARQMLYSVSLLSERLDERLARMDGDCFLAMSTDEVEDTRDLYEQVVRFAQAAGVSVVGIFPWDLWLARSSKTWGDAEPFTYGTHDEAVLYMKSVFEESLENAFDLIDAEGATPDNARAKAFVEYKKRKIHMEWRFANPFDHLTEQGWAEIEKRLQAKGALKFPLQGPKRQPRGD